MIRIFKRDLWRILKQSKEYAKYQKSIFFYTPLLLAVSLTNPYFIRYLFDEIIEKFDFSKLPLFMILFLAFKTLYHILDLAVDYSYSRCANVISAVERENIMEKLTRLPIETLKKEGTSTFFSNVSSDVPVLSQTLSEVFPGIILNSIYTALIGYVLVSFSWKLSIVVFASIPFYTSTVNIFAKNLKEAAAMEREENEEILAELKEDVEGAFVVKKHGSHKYMLRKYEKKAREWIIAKKRYYFISQLVEDFFAFLRSSIPVVVLSWGGYLLIKNEITLGTLVGFYTIMNWIYEPVSEIVNLFVSAKEAMPVYERLKKVYEMKEETKGHISLPSFKNACLDDVRFSYTGKEVLRGVNLRLYYGQSVAIVGLSGSGKSTLVSLLPRYYEATAGKVLINSEDVKEYVLRELRKKIIVVHQNDFLFNSTIRENITLGEQFTEEQFQEAVKIACVEKFIGELDKGYETIVGERGSKLSDGQRQRVAIARAVIRKPEVLILDEATSGVDSKTEEEIFEGLKKLGMTVIIVSHRLSTIKKAERIVVLDDGRIVEEGTHDELMERCDKYRQIIKAQLVG